MMIRIFFLLHCIREFSVFLPALADKDVWELRVRGELVNYHRFRPFWRVLSSPMITFQLSMMRSNTTSSVSWDFASCIPPGKSQKQGVVFNTWQKTVTLEDSQGMISCFWRWLNLHWYSNVSTRERSYLVEICQSMDISSDVRLESWIQLKIYFQLELSLN